MASIPTSRPGKAVDWTPGPDATWRRCGRWTGRSVSTSPATAVRARGVADPRRQAYRARDTAAEADGLHRVAAVLASRGRGSRIDPQVVMEAKSTYWVALAVSLHEADYQVFVINPARAHSFAKAQSRRAKTGALGAQDMADWPTSWN